MFATYISRGGMTVIGRKPMFEDFDDEQKGPAIKAKFLEVFGHYPILDLSEKYEIISDEELYMAEPVVLRDYHALLDTEKLDLVKYGLNYVDSLLERVIQAKINDPSITYVHASASKKYCFSDTEDWWIEMQLLGNMIPAGREKIEVIVELG